MIVPKRSGVNPRRTRTANSSRPTALRVTDEGIPEYLRQRPHWVVWRYTWDKGKGDWVKPPFSAKNGKAASSTNVQTHSTFEEAWEAYQTGKWDGIGYVPQPEDGLTIIDLDDCRDAETGAIEPWASRIVAEMNTYTEVSPSGAGLRIAALGSRPDREHCRKGGVEIYDGWTSKGEPGGRYLTFTGHRLPDSLTTIEERQEQIAAVYHRELATKSAPNRHAKEAPRPSLKIHEPLGLDDEEILKRAELCSKTGDRFCRLWSGSTNGYRSHSEADLALCGFLAFWVGPDPGRIDRLFRLSELMRGKWDEKRKDGSYGQRTVAKAVSGLAEPYSPRGATEPASSPTIPPKRVYGLSSAVSLLRSAVSSVFPSEEGKTLDWVAHPEILTAISQTLPTGKKASVRRNKLFAFARRLKALSQTQNCEVAQLRPLIRRWHDEALRFIGQVPFEDTWAAFIEAWPRVEHAAGAGPFEHLWAESATATEPQAARQYDDARVRRLVTFCLLLQRHAGEQPFPLDCRRVGELFGVPHKKAWSWLTQVLVTDGVLQRVAQGDWVQGRANEYFYVADGLKQKRVRRTQSSEPEVS